MRTRIGQCPGSVVGALCAVVYLAVFASPGAAAPPPGSYRYERLNVAGAAEAVAVAFHPHGRYAVVLERNDRVIVIDWPTGTAVSHVLTPESGTLVFDDLLFDASGGFALLVGSHVDAVTEGVVLRLDDRSLRAGAATNEVFRELPALRSARAHVGIAPSRIGGLPVLLSRDTSNFSTFQLRDIDPIAETFGPLSSATQASAGCEDLAVVGDGTGGEAVLVVCGINGSDALVYSGSHGGWSRVGRPSLGNFSSVAAHPREDHAILVDFSARRLRRFENGVLSSDSLWFPTQAILDVSFAPGGERALIVGQAGKTPLAAPVLEYRHDLFSQSDMIDVSIPNFDAAPYFGTRSTRFLASAWRPGCDGGLIVGGQQALVPRTLVVRFSLEGGTSCEPLIPIPGLFQALGWLVAGFLGLTGAGWSIRRARTRAA